MYDIYKLYNSFTLTTHILYFIYKYNIIFYVIYLLIIKRNYIEAFFIIYNLFKF
jgi:hypothetical protein